MTLQPKLDVDIEGETYFLDKVPDASSGIVKVETDKLLGAVDLKTLVDDLGRVGGFIRIAYNGIGAAGPKFTDHQIEVQRLGYDVTKLCDKSGITVAKFKKASSSILTDLQSTYGYLLDNLEEMALETLSAVSKLAGEMEKAAQELQQEFEDEEKKVVKILEKTQKVRGAEALHIKQKEKEREQMEMKKQEQEQLMMDQMKAQQEAEARRHHLEQEEDKAIAEIGSTSVGDVLKKMVNGFTSKIPLIGTEVFDSEGPEKRAAALRERRKEAFEKEQQIFQNRQAALHSMTEFACKIKDCNTEANMAKITEDALHQSIGALKELSAVMMRAAIFWKQMQDHCKSLAEVELADRVEKVVKLYSEEERLKVWTSNGFKIKAVQFYAGWVALFNMCDTHVKYIEVTQKDLHRYITENPTCEESRKNLKTLAEEFLFKLQSDQKAIVEWTRHKGT